jgi:hypothetical protein
MFCKRILVLLSIGLIIFALAACANMQIKEVWIDEESAGSPLQKAMIIGIAQNEQWKRLFEETFIEAFKQNGVDAFGSIAFVPLNEGLDADAIISIAEDQNADAILTLRLKKLQTKNVPTQPTGVHSEYYPEYYSHIRPYYRKENEAAQQEKYFREYKIYQLESNLYNVDDQKLRWSAASKTADPNSASREINKLSEMVMESFRKSNLLP